MQPVNFIFLAQCCYLPFLLILYFAVLLTILKPGTPFKGSFYVLFVASAVVDLLMVVVTFHEFRMMKFPLVNGSFKNYDCKFCLGARISISYVCPFAQDLLNCFVALNRFTSIRMPARHANIWRILVPFGICFSYLLSITVFTFSAFRVMYHVPLNVSDYVVYMLVVEDDSFVPWLNFHMISTIEMLITSTIIIALYSMAAWSLRKLVGSSATARQERVLLKVGMVNFAIAIPGIFLQSLLGLGFLPIPWMATIFLVNGFVIDSKFFCGAVAMVSINKSFREHLLNSLGLTRSSQFVALNKFTSIMLPARHATVYNGVSKCRQHIWRILHPFGIGFSYLLSIIVFTSSAFRIMYHVQRSESDYFVVEDENQLSHDVNNGNDNNEYNHNCSISDVRYFMAAWSLRKLVRSSATARQERMLLKVGIVNFAIAIPGIFQQMYDKLCAGLEEANQNEDFFLTVSAISSQVSNIRLIQCYNAILNKAVEKKAKRIVVPFIGCFSVNFPVQHGVDIALRTIQQFINGSNTGLLNEIYFCTTMALNHESYIQEERAQIFKQASRITECILNILQTNYGAARMDNTNNKQLEKSTELSCNDQILGCKHKDSDEGYSSTMNMLIQHKKVVIGLVNGPAIGFPCTFLGLFDYVVCSESAYFHTPFMSLGMPPEGASTAIFRR
uniref:Serpentine receptor class gamma n=1 Tax=Pristionchus pacificus TaxID=54126 RepID=A0A8R1UWC0_PRIPA